MDTDKGDERCLTCDNSDLAGNNGNPEWHPSGEYVIFQGEDVSLRTAEEGLQARVEDLLTTPGGGYNSNLWITNAQGERFWKLTSVRAGEGSLHPQFSPDGATIAWSNRIGAAPGGRQGALYGDWNIALGTLRLGDSPTVEDIQILKPDEFQFYETHGFSPDGNALFLSVLEYGAHLSSLDCARYDLDTGTLTLLTDSPTEWDEFCHLSPSGNRVVWISTEGIEQQRDRRGNIALGNYLQEDWVMDSDGQNKERLTYFNDPRAPEYVRGGVVTADYSWSPDGTQLAAKIRRAGPNPLATEMIVIISLQ
jgi:Tol biopolymer transport system component